MSLQLIKTPTGEVALVVNSQLILDGEAEDDSAKLTEQTAERLAMALNEPLQAIQVEPTAADWTWDDLVSHMATSAASQSRSSAEVKSLRSAIRIHVAARAYPTARSEPAIRMPRRSCA